MTTVLADPPPDLRVLREELAELRRTHGRRSTVVLEAWERLWRASVELGQPLSALRRHTRDETERFFAQTIPGPDGHVYWDGTSDRFVRNDGKQRVPRRWWYAHKHGVELAQHADLVPTCGELHCINPDHCEVGRNIRRMRIGREAMLGSLRVAALRLGRAPTSGEWDSLGLSPSRTLYKLRFGGWQNALREAGITVIHAAGGQSTTPAACIASLRHLRESLGHWPTEGEFRRSKDVLHAAGLPAAPGTIRRHLGLWNDALRKAGKR